MTEAYDATADAIDVDDLVAADASPEVPELDPEAALLCALLHTAETEQARAVTQHLEEADFLNPRYGELFRIISELANAGEQHHATRVLAALRGAGRLSGHHGKLLTDALQIVALLGTPAVGLVTLAADVLDAAYRRRFAAAAAALTRASAEAATDDLFDLMLAQGRAMRVQARRREALDSGPVSD
ncbi:DnaB-like helicase N-terminal domain-containing protein [Dietzia sp. 179-F 9C3 NHS]|uniref:DnaB-like helicase N-terminal domain-containing protein n=1 Tax=Dietzia sp. 179-F 9C3 NHS TaxID=3374295 RepID=UPI00387A3936